MVPWFVSSLPQIILNYTVKSPFLPFLVTVCNFVVHDRCLKAVVSPCSTIAAGLIKVRIPSVSVFAPFVWPEMSEFFPRDLYLRTAENTWLHSIMVASKVPFAARWTSWTPSSALTVAPICLKITGRRTCQVHFCRFFFILASLYNYKAIGTSIFPLYIFICNSVINTKLIVFLIRYVRLFRLIETSVLFI